VEANHSILVVDDDPSTVALVRDWYRDKPYEILAAPDGQVGLRLALKHRPNLILLDLKMPVLDGIATASKLKQDPSTAAIPIILLTACKDVDAKVDAFKAGVEDFVTKPFALEEVEARIESWLRRSRYFRGLEAEVDTLTASKGRLEKLLMLDEKTGLFNFREFQRRLTDEWQRASRYRTPLSLVFFDVDHFKQVNDTLGHQAGDSVLRQFAMLVAGGARTNDVAARYGGEEFAVILPHTDGEMAARVAERIRRAVEETVFLEDESPQRITVSAGVATFPSRSEIDSVDALIRAADGALYRAKDAGRNRVVQNGSLNPSAPRGT
jgi:two-component system cell cycle response regulator